MRGKLLTALVTSLMIAAPAVSGLQIVTHTLTVCEEGPPACDHDSIQDALDAATVGARIVVEPGRYVESVTVDVEGVTIEGTDRSDVILDAPGTQRAMTVRSDDTTLRSFTVIGPSGTDNYGIHVSDVNDADDPYVSGLVVEDLTVGDSARSELDLHGVVNAQIRDSVFAGNGTAGVGLAVTDSFDVQIESIATDGGNTWGGIAVFTSGAYLDCGTSGVSVEDATLRENPPLYVQTHGCDVERLFLPGFAYQTDLLGDSFSTFDFYHKDLARATDLVPACDPADEATHSIVRDLNHTDHGVEPANAFHVAEPMCVGPATDHVEADGRIGVHPGTYTEGPVVVRDEGVGLEGVGDATPTLLANTSHVRTPNKCRNHKPTLGLRAPNVTLAGIDVTRVVDGDCVPDNDKHTKALGVKAPGITVRDVDVALRDDVGDGFNTALWIANLFNPDAPALEDVVVEDVAVDGDQTAAGVCSLSNNGVDGVELSGVDLTSSDTGLLTCAVRGNVSGLDVHDGSFADNELQLQDLAGAVDPGSLLADNAFDQAVVVDGDEQTIWSDVQDGLDNATADGTAVVHPGEYTERLTGFPSGVTLTNAVDDPGETTIRAPDGGAFDIRSDGVTVEGLTIVGKNSRVKGVEGVTLRDNVIVGTPHGLNVAGAQVTLDGNRFEAGDPGAGNAFKLHGAGADGSVVVDNTVTGFDNGPILNGVQLVEIRDNSFADLDQYGVLLVSKGRVVRAIQVDGNTFQDASFGLLAHENRDAARPSVIHNVSAHFNTFEGVAHGVLGLRTPPGAGQPTLEGPTGTLDATHNWWGAPTGPIPAEGQFLLESELEPAPVASAGGNVDTAPFCAEPGCTSQHVLHEHGPHPHIRDLGGSGPL